MPAPKNAAAAPATATARTLTEYVVLQQKDLIYPQDDGDAHESVPVKAWVEIGRAEAIGDLKAIDLVTADKKIDGGTFTAPPTRSWKTRTVLVEVVQKRKVS